MLKMGGRGHDGVVHESVEVEGHGAVGPGHLLMHRGSAAIVQRVAVKGCIGVEVWSAASCAAVDGRDVRREIGGALPVLQREVSM